MQVCTPALADTQIAIRESCIIDGMLKMFSTDALISHHPYAVVASGSE